MMENPFSFCGSACEPRSRPASHDGPGPAARMAVERSEILDGHRSGGYVHLGGSDPFYTGSLPPILVVCPRAKLLPSFCAFGYFSSTCRSSVAKAGLKGGPKVACMPCVTLLPTVRARRDATLASKRAAWPSTSSVLNETSCLGARSRNSALTVSDETCP